MCGVSKMQLGYKLWQDARYINLYHINDEIKLIPDKEQKNISINLNGHARPLKMLNDVILKDVLKQKDKKFNIILANSFINMHNQNWEKQLLKTLSSLSSSHVTITISGKEPWYTNAINLAARN